LKKAAEAKKKKRRKKNGRLSDKKRKKLEKRDVQLKLPNQLLHPLLRVLFPLLMARKKPKLYNRI